jgi:hypothetical protein
VGLVEWEDAESGRQYLIDTSSQAFQTQFQARVRQRREELRRLARGAALDLIDVTTDGTHLDALVRFFQQRERRQRRT